MNYFHYYVLCGRRSLRSFSWCALTFWVGDLCCILGSSVKGPSACVMFCPRDDDDNIDCISEVHCGTIVCFFLEGWSFLFFFCCLQRNTERWMLWVLCSHTHYFSGPQKSPRRRRWDLPPKWVMCAIHKITHNYRFTGALNERFKEG